MSNTKDQAEYIKKLERLVQKIKKLERLVQKLEEENLKLSHRIRDLEEGDDQLLNEEMTQRLYQMMESK